MGGEIGVDSEPDKGSTFWFSVKFSKPRFVSNIDYRKSHTSKLPHILIVDDNKTNRKILERQLEAWDFTYHSVESGLKALNAVEKQQNFDIILLDMMMPGMNGFEVAERINNNKQIHHPKIILLSSIMQDKSNKELNKIGIQLSLPKPVRQSLLFDNIIGLNENYASLHTDSDDDEQSETTDLTNAEKQNQILIAEDNPVNQKVVAGILKQLGYQADIVNNGVEAVDAIQTHTYDLVFMDCQMPELDGYEATRRIRQMADGKKDTTIIALTANAMKGDKEKCTSAGMNDYLAKPIRPESMKDMLNKWIN